MNSYVSISFLLGLCGKRSTANETQTKILAAIPHFDGSVATSARGRENWERKHYVRKILGEGGGEGGKGKNMPNSVLIK